MVLNFAQLPLSRILRMEAGLVGWNVWFFPRDFASQSLTFVPRQHCSAPPTNRGEPGVSGAADTELAGGRCRRLSGSASAAK